MKSSVATRSLDDVDGGGADIGASMGAMLGFWLVVLCVSWCWCAYPRVSAKKDPIIYSKSRGIFVPQSDIFCAGIIVHKAKDEFSTRMRSIWCERHMRPANSGVRKVCMVLLTCHLKS